MGRALTALFYGVVLAGLVACGGGGGGGGGSAAGGGFVPRTAPTAAVLNTPDDAGYAARKTTFETSAEYDVAWELTTDPSINGEDTHLRRINAAAAYARGATGAGERIMIVDSGIRETHREFAGTGKVRKQTDPGYVPNNNDKFHGTFVAALAVGNRDGGSGLNMHGVAFDAGIYVREIRLGTSDGIYRPTRLENVTNADDRSDGNFFRNVINTANAQGAAILNQSFGRNGAISTYSRAEVRSRLGDTAAAFAQAGTPNADKTIVVWAAGNAGGHRLQGGGTPVFDSPEFWAGLGAYFPELQSHVLAVVALDQNGSIASYSNRCGIAKAFCLAAPGSDIVSAFSSSNNDYELQNGTSLAAPIVSGSLALLRQYFRGQLGNTEVVNRLLATANRDGIYANSDIYGHGLVDLDAATSPVGAVMSGLPGTPGNRPLADAELTLAGGAFGASLQQQLQNIEIAGFDSLGAPFFQSAANFNPTTPPRSWRAQADAARRSALQLALQPAAPDGAQLALHLDRHGAVASARIAAGGWFLAHGDSSGQMLGLRDDPQDGAISFAAPHLSLVRDGIGFGWARGGGGFALLRGAPRFDGEHASGGENGFGMLLAVPMRFGDASRRGAFGNQRSTGLWLQAGALREGDGFLGARPQGLLGRARGATWFAGVNGAWNLAARNPWRLSASAYLGRTRTDLHGGFLRDGEELHSSAFSLGAARGGLWRRGDRLDLRLSQPLRVERGGITLRAPAGRTRYGAVVHRSHQVSLAPSGRALRAGATYRIGLAGGALASTLGLERHPQHDRARNAEMFTSIRFERRF